jgi:hypothetical protein
MFDRGILASHVPGIALRLRVPGHGPNERPPRQKETRPTRADGVAGSDRGEISGQGKSLDRCAYKAGDGKAQRLDIQAERPAQRSPSATPKRGLLSPKLLEFNLRVQKNEG